MVGRAGVSNDIGTGRSRRMAKSHGVQLMPGRGLTAAFPFGRLQVRADGIRLYARLIPGVGTYELVRPDVERIVLTRGLAGKVTMRIEDSAGLASRVRVRLLLPSGKIRRELAAHGYPVVVGVDGTH
jgi:hypothetical protein